ncbi:MAG TPA: S8 family serine peptidase [Streptosporangiaceae bacterium]|nr:S8 family serine peptidase [Streptosporangiaceae bacterium]
MLTNRARPAVVLAAAAAVCGPLAVATPCAQADAATTAAVPPMRAACPSARPGYARCFTLYAPQVPVNQAIAAGARGPAAQPKGWSPQDLQFAYRLPATASSSQTVAVSIAFDTPKLTQYLAVYRQHYGLPACTTASGCLKVVNQQGANSPLPPSGVGTGWDLEATLDVSMISAACPHCHILVVEATAPTFADLAASEDTAARLGAQVISNSYGAREDGIALSYASAYAHPGHTIVVSAGDAGFSAANFPADLPTVTAVGGTELSRAHNARGWAETVWNSSGGAGGSGCSAYVPKPAWQHDQHCPGRTVADVAAVAHNIPIYNKDYGGWVTVAGTSISAPLVAGTYSLAGNAATLTPGSIYQHTSQLFDITAGSNAIFGTPRALCGDDYLCVAKKGYDAPTGLGSPDGTSAF